MPYKVIANFSENGHPFEIGEIYEKKSVANGDLMEEVKEKANAEAPQLPEKKEVMTTKDIKQK